MECTGETTIAANRMKNDVHSTTDDDNRLQSTFESIGLITVPAMGEVNIFKDDDTIIQILNPKVEACVAANAWVVSGSSQTKNLRDILSGILNRLGPDKSDSLRKLAEQLQLADQPQKQALVATCDCRRHCHISTT